MTQPQPFVLEVSATASLRVLVYADDIETADDIMGGRFDELQAQLVATAGLPTADSPSSGYVLYDYDVRPAEYREVVASPGNDEALHTELPTFQVCTCDTEAH